MGYIHVAKRTYVDKKTIDAVERDVSALGEAAEIGRRYEAIMTLIPTIASDLSDSQDRVDSLLQTARIAGWNVKDKPYNQTAGQKFSEHLFGKRPEDNADVVALMCLDQYPLSKNEHWDAMMGLADKLRRDGKTYANGSRNVEVALGVHKNNSERRIIHEMVHSLAGGAENFATSLTIEGNPHRGYARFGESTSGLYILHRNGKFYPKLQEIVEAHANIAAVNGFAIEYMTAILAAKQSQVSSGYVYAVRNPFYSQVSEEDEKAKMLKWIGDQTKLTGRTPARFNLDALISHAYMPFSTDILKEVFDGRLVDEVTDVMRKSLAA